MDRIEEKTPYDSPLKSVLLSFKEDLLLQARVKINSENVSSALPAIFGQLPGDSWRRVKILDEFREYVTDQELKSDLGSIRQLILDLSGRSRNINKPHAERVANDARTAANSLKDKLASLNVKSSLLNALLAKAEFNLEQAEESAKSGQFLSVFGQASVAAAAAKSGLNQFFQYNNLGQEVRNLKAAYDLTINTAAQNNLNKENSPKLFKLLSDTEGALAKVSDLANKNAKADLALPALLETRILLLESRQLLTNLLVRLAEAERLRQESQSLIQRVLQ